MGNEVKHHRISMSQWSTLAVCPHFVPSRKPSPEADAGTAAHKEAAEIYSKISGPGGKPEDAFKHEGKYPQAAWCASAYLGMALCDDLDARPADGQTVSCAVEVKVAIQQTDPLVDGIYGYADFVRLLRREDGSLMEVTVADFKTFSDGTRNYDEQMAGYAVAVASTIPDAGDDVPARLYTLHGLARKSTVTITTLGECRRLAVDTVMKYLCRDRFPKVTNPRCKYCQKYPCDGAIQLLKSVLPEFATRKLTEADMDADPQGVPLTLAALEEAQKLIDATKETAAAIIKKHGTKGITKDGLPKWELGTDECRYEVREALGSRKIPDVPAACGELSMKSNGEITKDALIGICSMPVGKLETLVRKTLGKGPKEAGEWLASLGIVARGPNTETMKRIA